MSVIYLIDDDKVFNFLNETLIKKEKGDQYQVQSFDNARAALEKIRYNISLPDGILPSKIFLDINMPEMDGWEFLDEFEQIQFNEHNCEVIMLTSSISPLDIAKSRTYSCVRDFVSKPITSEKLNELLDGPEKN